MELRQRWTACKYAPHPDGADPGRIGRIAERARPARGRSEPRPESHLQLDRERARPAVGTDSDERMGPEVPSRVAQARSRGPRRSQPKNARAIASPASRGTRHLTCESFFSRQAALSSQRGVTRLPLLAGSCHRRTQQQSAQLCELPTSRCRRRRLWSKPVANSTPLDFTTSAQPLRQCPRAMC